LKSYKTKVSKRKRKVAHLDLNEDHESSIRKNATKTEKIHAAECFASFLETGGEKTSSYTPVPPKTLSGVKGLAALLKYLIELKTVHEVEGISSRTFGLM
jgi:hypothetical protein